MDNTYIDIKDVNNRISRLSESASNRSNVNVKSCYEKMINSNKFNKQLMDICVENWTALNDNNEKSFKMIINAFEHMCLSEGINNNLISYYCNIICESAIPKVRDGKQMQSYINRNLGRLKTKLSTRINNNIDTAKNVVSNTINGAKNNLDNNTNNIKNNVNKSLNILKKSDKKEEKEKEEKDKTVSESFEKFYNAATIMVNCDRVINNYNKISKRFNTDKLLYESIDLQDFISDYCRLVDTYSVSNTNKFIIATETAMYILEKNHIKYEKPDILKYASDYFISKDDCSIEDIKNGLDATLFYDPRRGDTEDLEYITEYDPEVDNNDNNTKEFKENSNYNTYNLDYIIETELKKNPTSKEIFNKFKELPNKTVDGLKTVIKRMYSSSDTMIIEDVPNILSYIRTIFIPAVGFAINPIVGVVFFIADQAISLGIKRNETKKLIEKYEKEKEKTEKKISKLNKDSSAKTRYEEYLKSLDKSIDKLEEYYKNLLTDKENDKREEEKYSKNMNNDSDFDFNIDDDEWKVENIMSDISDKMQFINEHQLSDSINKLTTSTLLKTDCNSIDILTEFISSYGTENDIFNFMNILENTKKESRKNNLFILTDCLNDNINKLSEGACLNEINTFDILNAYYEFSNIINDIASINSNVFTEISFINNLTLAGEKLRKTMIKMSDAEKNASKNVDITLNNMKKAAERALENDNREAIIKGSILPSASKIIKITLTSGIVALFSPAAAVIGLLGYIGCSARMKAKERQMVLDEIEIELNMVERYLKIAEEKNDLKAQRELLKTQRLLQRQQQRIKYKMKVEFNQDVPSIKPSEDD